jgi:AGZA family xanthine/uracil permease-like MFS transporter
VGLLPGVAAWGVLMAKAGLRAAEAEWGPGLVDAFHVSDTWIEGGFALEQGFIFTSMVLSAATVCVIERRFRVAAIWCAAAAGLAATGLVHGWQWTHADAALALGPVWPFVAAYGAMAAIFAAAEWVTEPGEGH